jgi:hypothetical protein
MCTVSWAPGPEGYTLFFNRDERLSRSPAEPPRVRELMGVRYLSPLDGDFGGTWLAANEFGLALGILNRYRVQGYVPPPRPRSRGFIVLDLVGHAGASDAIAALEHQDLDTVQPFTLVALEPGQPARMAAWDGRALTVATHRAPGLILTSSSVTEPEVAANRRALFSALDVVTPEALLALHRSHQPERGRRSICMHREEAETQSLSEVSVTAGEIRLTHIPDAPCRGTPLPVLALARRPVPCPTPH